MRGADKQMVLLVMFISDRICVMMCGAVKTLRILPKQDVKLYLMALYTVNVVARDKY